MCYSIMNLSSYQHLLPINSFLHLIGIFRLRFFYILGRTFIIYKAAIIQFIASIDFIPILKGQQSHHRYSHTIYYLC